MEAGRAGDSEGTERERRALCLVSMVRVQNNPVRAH